MHFRTRVGLFIEDLVECCRGNTIVAVCHGGVVEAAFDHIFNIGPWRRTEIWNTNTGITHFEYVELPRARPGACTSTTAPSIWRA